MLGITWDGVPAGPYRLQPHAVKMAASKGFTREQVLEAANTPSHTYANGRYPGQFRHIKGSVCAVVNPATKSVITVYLNTLETEVRPDQKDPDAVRFASRKSLAAGKV